MTDEWRAEGSTPVFRAVAFSDVAADLGRMEISCSRRKNGGGGPGEGRGGEGGSKIELQKDKQSDICR